MLINQADNLVHLCRLMYTPITMPGLAASLRAFEPDQLEQIALFWGVGVPAGSKSSMRLVLELNLVDNEGFQNIFESLSDLAQSALLDLKAAGGQMNWSNFSHRYGEIRAMGPTRRKKEQPWAFPVSISEILWYRGLIGRDFLREGGDLQDMAYLPDEFFAFLPDTLPQELTHASLSPQKLEVDTNTRESNVLADVCTLLAAHRFEQPEKQLAKTSREPGYWQLVGALLQSVSVLDANNEPADLARLLLEMPRWQGLPWLQQQWLNTSGFNEFDFIPGLHIESDEPIDTRKARQKLVSFLSGQNFETWFSLDELMELMKKTDPDFLRQQEQYFSWTVVRQAQPEVPLAGLESWLDVEGAFIRFVVTQMLPLLGAAQSLEAEKGKVWFRLQPQFFSNATSAAPGSAELGENSLIVSSTGKIVMTDRSPLILRYQVSRFCDWLSIETNEFTYQLSPNSLSLAREQGLLPKHLITLLRKNAQGGLPPALYEAIRRWESSGSQAKIESLLILQVASPEMLQTLREAAAGRWLGEALGPTAVILKPGGQGPVRQALASLGYLSDHEESEIENV